MKRNLTRRWRGRDLVPNVGKRGGTMIRYRR
jgi:hypothetical protein